MLSICTLLTSISTHTGKSTDMALNNLVENITTSLQNREIAVAAFLDIEGAFNNTLPDSLHEAVCLGE